MTGHWLRPLEQRKHSFGESHSVSWTAGELWYYISSCDWSNFSEQPSPGQACLWTGSKRLEGEEIGEAGLNKSQLAAEAHSLSLPSSGSLMTKSTKCQLQFVWTAEFQVRASADLFDQRFDWSPPSKRLPIKTVCNVSLGQSLCTRNWIRAQKNRKCFVMSIKNCVIGKSASLSRATPCPSQHLGITQRWDSPDEHSRRPKTESKRFSGSPGRPSRDWVLQHDWELLGAWGAIVYHNLYEIIVAPLWCRLPCAIARPERSSRCRCSGWTSNARGEIIRGMHWTHHLTLTRIMWSHQSARNSRIHLARAR
jgi:hypothetical protein